VIAVDTALPRRVVPVLQTLVIRRRPAAQAEIYARSTARVSQVRTTSLSTGRPDAVDSGRVLLRKKVGIGIAPLAACSSAAERDNASRTTGPRCTTPTACCWKPRPVNGPGVR
jgi:hypothetical protein